MLRIIFKLIILFFIILILALKYFKYHRKKKNEENHINILRKTSTECTLFLNKNDEFPIENPCNVFLIYFVHHHLSYN